MKKLSLLLSSLLLILAFTAEAKSPPPGTGKADVPANILFMVDTSGSMRASTNTNTSNKLLNPYDVAVDSQGNIFVVDNGDHKIKKYNSSGAWLKTFGGYGYQNGKFRYPGRIDIDVSDNLYISDYRNNRIQKLDNNGNWKKNFTGVWRPSGVTVDTSGNVYAGNYGNTIMKWDTNGKYLTQWSTPNSWILGLDFYGGNLYVSTYYGSTFFKYSGSGVLLNTWTTSGRGYIQNIKVNSNGIYISNRYDHKIEKYSLAGVYVKQWGYYGTGNSNFRYQVGIGDDSYGNIYVADYYNKAIKKFDANGVYVSSIGGDSGSRIADAKKVIKKLVSSSDLTKGANFGLMKWHSNAQMLVKISSTGASKIYNTIDSLYAAGGTNLDNAMRTAQSYFSGSSSPINSSASCQKNFLIVISDGYWYDSVASKIAENLYKTKGIQTFVIGFHTGGNSNYTKLAKAGGTYPDSPLYSSNWQHLYETLSSYIRQAISSSLTFTAPVVMPDIKSGDHIYQSTFTYKKNHQWKGKLTKYTLKSD